MRISVTVKTNNQLCVFADSVTLKLRDASTREFGCESWLSIPLPSGEVNIIFLDVYLLNGGIKDFDTLNTLDFHGVEFLEFGIVDGAPSDYFIEYTGGFVVQSDVAYEFVKGQKEDAFSYGSVRVDLDSETMEWNGITFPPNVCSDLHHAYERMCTAGYLLEEHEEMSDEEAWDYADEVHRPWIKKGCMGERKGFICPGG